MIRTHTSETALWVDLVQEAKSSAKINLTEIQEGYLVFMLMRFLKRREVFSITIALQYLEGVHATGAIQESLLADTGDSSLLFAGLYPERAKSLNVSSSYFVDMSCICFSTLSTLCAKKKHLEEAKLYEELATNTVNLATVLGAMRTTGGNQVIICRTGHEIMH